MQKSFKRTLSLLLAVIMVVTLFTALPLTVSAAENEPEIVGTSITLDGAIGLNFYVKENGTTDYYPYFNYDDSRLGYGDSEATNNLNDDPEYDATGVYRIYTINLYAKQMTEEITFSVSETETITTSVREYAEKMIRGENDAYLAQQYYSAEKIAKAKELCKAMLNYGAQAQLEFGYNTDDLANKNCSDYTAPALNAASITDIDYTDPTGAWITESSRVYQFVNTYDWEHVYAHCVSGAYSDSGDVFADDTVVEIFPSGYTYTNPYEDSDSSNGKSIYLFEPAGEFRYLVFTNTPGSLDNVQVYDYEEYKYSYSYVEMEYNGDCVGWKNWINGGDDRYSYNVMDSSPVHFIDFVNAQNWSTVSVDVTTNQWDSDQGKNVDVSQNYAMTKLSEKAADGSDIYRFILPDAFTNKYEVTIKFTNGSDATLKTTYETGNNIHRYTPSQRTDKFEQFGMTYSGSSVGLLQKIGYSLFFFKLENYSNPDVYLGETTDDSYRLDSNIMEPYNEMGYLCYSIREIAPSDLLKPIKITFKVWSSEENGYITKTVNFSVYNYIKRALMLDDSNANVQLKKTVTALVDYAQKAEAFFNEP